MGKSTFPRDKLAFGVEEIVGSGRATRDWENERIRAWRKEDSGEEERSRNFNSLYLYREALKPENQEH